MALSKGTQLVNNPSSPHYIGIASISIVALNPSKEELTAIYNREPASPPEYVTYKTEENGNQTATAKLEFIVKTSITKGEETRDILKKLSFYIKNAYMYNRDKTKVQVIDKFGRTAWVTIEQAKAREIPMYKNGPANLDKEYRPAYIGENSLTGFLKTYLNISSPTNYVNGTWILKENTEDCECRLDHIQDYFKRDFTEVSEALAYLPNNTVQALFGVQTGEDGGLFTIIYKEAFLSEYSSSYTKFEKEIANLSPMYEKTEFLIEPLKEFIPKPTTFKELENPAPQSVNPFTSGWSN